MVDKATPFLANIEDESALIRGLALLGDSLRRNHDIQALSNELLRLWHLLHDLPSSSQSPIVVTLLCQRLTEYCEAYEVAARVHTGSGAPFASIVPYLRAVRGMAH